MTQQNNSIHIGHLHARDHWCTSTYAITCHLSKMETRTFHKWLWTLRGIQKSACAILHYSSKGWSFFRTDCCWFDYIYTVITSFSFMLFPYNSHNLHSLIMSFGFHIHLNDIGILGEEITRYRRKGRHGTTSHALPHYEDGLTPRRFVTTPEKESALLSPTKVALLPETNLLPSQQNQWFPHSACRSGFTTDNWI